MASRLVSKFNEVSIKSICSGFSATRRGYSLSPFRSNTKNCKHKKLKRSQTLINIRNIQVFSNFKANYFGKKSKATSEDEIDDENNADIIEKSYEETDDNSLPDTKTVSFNNPSGNFKLSRPNAKMRPQSATEPTQIVYELDTGNQTDASDRSTNLFYYLTDMHRNHMSRINPHLQPNNMKPYNSSENISFPAALKRQFKIVYPTVLIAEQSSSAKVTTTSKEIKKVSAQQRTRGYCTFEKENPGYYEDDNNVTGIVTNSTNVTSDEIQETVVEPASSLMMMKQIVRDIPKKEPIEVEEIIVNEKETEQFCAPLRKPEDANKLENINDEIINLNIDDINNNKKAAVPWPSYSERIKMVKPSSKYPLINNKFNNFNRTTDQQHQHHHHQTRHISTNTINRNELNKPNFVKMSLNKKIKITKKKLPKLNADKCPCINSEPLKDSKPLTKPKKRYQPKDPDRICEKDVACDWTQRSDYGLIVHRKYLPEIKTADCPCIETTMTDVPLKRLPKNTVAEPIKICPPPPEVICPPRADVNRKLKKKVLPYLKAKDCPCVEQNEPVSVPLVRLKAKKVVQPRVVCHPASECVLTDRADYHKKIVSKKLPVMEPSSCPCVNIEVPNLAPPLIRLKKVDIPEPPKICEINYLCSIPRADDKLKIKSKKLPVIKPKYCPCVEQDPMTTLPLKRLRKKYQPKDRDDNCRPPPLCEETPRSDQGLKVKRKTLPKIVSGECPCIETKYEDVPPLKKLIPKPVAEPPRCKSICIGAECCPPRADKNLKIKSKSLPALKAGNCPCVNREELKDVRPLGRLNLKMSDPPKKVCVTEEKCTAPRTDANRKIKPKQLPPLVASKCPCVNAPPLKDVGPLKRLKKVPHCEMDKHCLVSNICDVTPRSDTDDWSYVKEDVKKTRKEREKKPHAVNLMNNSVTKRKYSTYSSAIHNNLITNETNYFVSNLQAFAANNEIKKTISARAAIDCNTVGLNFDRVAGDNTSTTKRHKCTLNTVTETCSLTGAKRRKTEIKYPIVDQKFVLKKPPPMIPLEQIGNKKIMQPQLNATKSCGQVRSGKKSYTQKSSPSKSGKNKSGNKRTSQCSPGGTYLQPKNPQIKASELLKPPALVEKEVDRKVVEECKKRKQEQEVAECTTSETMCSQCRTIEIGPEECEEQEKSNCEPLSLWQRIVNYFKARPNCPTPEEFRMMRLRAAAEKAALKAGLCLYDPKDYEEKESEMVVAKSCQSKETGNDADECHDVDDDDDQSKCKSGCGNLAKFKCER